RSNKPRREANGGAQCRKSARCVRRGGGWKRGAVETLRPKPARQSSTLPMRGMWKRSYGRATKAPPDERGGNRHARPTATAPHPDSTRCCQFPHDKGWDRHRPESDLRVHPTSLCGGFGDWVGWVAGRPALRLNSYLVATALKKWLKLFAIVS